MASFVGTDRNLISLSLTSLCACPCRLSSSRKPLIYIHKRFRGFNLGIVFEGSKSVLPVRRTGSSMNRRLIAAVARAEPDRFNEGNAKEVMLCKLSGNPEIAEKLLSLMQAFGRTQLTSISPKKTWEGTTVVGSGLGLGGCIATTVVLSKLFCWPTSLLSVMIAFGILNFFGYLTESMIKREAAGVKDSGSLIPGRRSLLVVCIKTITCALCEESIYVDYVTRSEILLFVFPALLFIKVLKTFDLVLTHFNTNKIEVA